MSDIVPSEEIEDIVGAERRPVTHLARAVSAEETVYVLHSKECLKVHADLRDCDYSLALDRGIRLVAWNGLIDKPVVAGINSRGRLVPVKEVGRGRDPR